MHVEPILASRKMQVNALTRVIEKQIRDGIAEACVMPCYDDIPFFDTSNMRHRGGIFNDFAKQRGAGTVPISTEMTAEGLEAKATPTSTIGTIPEHLRQGGGSITAVPPSVMADALDLPTQHTKGAIRSRADSGQSNAAPDVSGDGAMTSGIAKSLSSGTKKWFAGRNGSGDSPGPSTSAFNPEGEYGAIRSQGPSPSSISNHTASKSGPDSPKPDVDRAPSTSVEGSSDQATYRHAQSTEPPSLSESRPSHPLSQASDNHDDIAQQLGVSSESVSTEQTPGSLIETIRSRAKDKQALQTSVNQAKDAMRKWGNNWAARRNIPLTSSPRTNEESVTSQEDALVDQSTSTSRPSAAHHNQAARSVDIPRSGLTLKERLANATLLATSPPERNIRHSTESERSSWGGYLSQSLDSEEVPVMSRHTASPIIKQPLQHQSTKEAQISRPKIPERPKTMKAISYASASAPQVDAAISNASAPPLPPRLNDMSNDERSSSAPLEQSASRSVTKLPGTAVPDAQDSHTAINPPSLPPRAPAAGHSSDKARGTSMDVAVDSNSSSPVPSPSLPKAEAVLKNVIASSTRGDDIGPL
ncbi:hypothetical protein QFC19_007764 [Naganishia cerealis]|uniref:Uncharacterized protein n=1 Tax=Naganishia cerealis TaxID=610337 RepID=A0ACC2V759_9TREE|nr:hypothetical protein QFC19_007764 [Naganishia cerealis]